MEQFLCAACRAGDVSKHARQPRGKQQHLHGPEKEQMLPFNIFQAHRPQTSP